MSTTAFPAAPPPPAPPAPRRVTRRGFLRTTVPAALGIALAAAGVGAALDWLGARTRLRWGVRAAENYARAYSYAWLPPAERIARHFDYLTLDPAGVRRFVRDYEKTFGRVRFQSLAANRLLYTKFLMSTDFFQNGADERRPVRYVALHDAYASPCYTPFTPAPLPPAAAPASRRA